MVFAEILDFFMDLKVETILLGFVRLEIPDAKILSKSSSSEVKRMSYL